MSALLNELIFYSTRLCTTIFLSWLSRYKWYVGSFILGTEGANGYQAIDYKVYVMDMANANDTANTYKVTI